MFEKETLRSALFTFCGVHVCAASYVHVFNSFAYVPCISQTHFSVNNDMQQHGNTLTYDLVQCDSFNKCTIAWRWPSPVETYISWCDLNVIFNTREIVNSLSCIRDRNVWVINENLCLEERSKTFLLNIFHLSTRLYGVIFYKIVFFELHLNCE
jgi:hypothetical protein